MKCRRTSVVAKAGQADETFWSLLGLRSQKQSAGLAMGADGGIHIEASHDTEPLAVAKLLKEVVAREEPGLVLCGKQAIDDDSNQTGRCYLRYWAGHKRHSHQAEIGDKANIVRG